MKSFIGAGKLITEGTENIERQKMLEKLSEKQNDTS